MNALPVRDQYEVMFAVSRNSSQAVDEMKMLGRWSGSLLVLAEQRTRTTATPHQKMMDLIIKGLEQ